MTLDHAGYLICRRNVTDGEKWVELLKEAQSCCCL